MSSDDSAIDDRERRPLSVPSVEAKAFRRNLVKLATCELRFPILLEYEKEPPSHLQRKLRKAYPHYEKNVSLTLHPGQGSTEETRFFFRSKRRDWAVTFRANAIAIETNTYTDYDDFRERIDAIVSIATEVIDSDFFTRVGLRYVNYLPVSQPEAGGWLNADLAAPLVKGIWGDVDQAWQEVHGVTPEGQYSLRHGYPQRDSGYILDLDIFQTDVEVTDLESVLARLNGEAYSLFSWCIGPKAREHMQADEKETAG